MGAGASIQIDEKTSNMLKEETMKPIDASDVATPRGESAKAEVIRLRALIAENAGKSNESFNTTSSRLVPETYLSASTILKQIHSKEKSCVDIVKASLQRIEDTKVINACIDVLTDSALAAAKAVDEKIAAGGTLRKLEGLPIFVKLNIEGPNGSLVSASTPGLLNFRPNKTAPIIQKLIDAGAIPIAKTNMPEMAVGLNGKSPVHGRCLNPINLDYNCGASSSGNGAGIAAGIVSCGIGTDTAGSTRIPSALCGIVGVRPSKGRYSTEGVVPITSLRDTPGPQGAFVSDVCLLDHVITGDALVAYNKDALKGKRIIIPHDWIKFKAKDGLSEDVQKSLDLVKSALKSAGAEVIEDVEGMVAVLESNKDTWAVPFLPVPVENTYADLKAYVDRHDDLKMEDMVKFDSAMISAVYKQKEGTAEELKVLFDKRDEGVKKMEAAYQEYLKANNANLIMVPACAQEITRIDDENEGKRNFANEFLFSFHMNECNNQPSMAFPIRNVKHATSGIPTSVLLYGTNDQELLEMALCLEQQEALL